jgi:hypothetical protein
MSLPLALSLDLASTRTDGIAEKVSVRAYADSAYEYMLNQRLLSGRTDANARDPCMILLTHGTCRPPLGRCHPRSSHIHIT